MYVIRINVNTLSYINVGSIINFILNYTIVSSNRNVIVIINDLTITLNVAIRIFNIIVNSINANIVIGRNNTYAINNITAIITTTLDINRVGIIIIVIWRGNNRICWFHSKILINWSVWSIIHITHIFFNLDKSSSFHWSNINFFQIVGFEKILVRFVNEVNDFVWSSITY